MLPRLVNGGLSRHAHAILLESRPQITRLSQNTFHLSRRTYALSRFPQRTAGTGRRRDTLPRKPSGVRPTIEEKVYEKEGMRYEEKPSMDEWPAWQESVHRVSRNPDEGLRRLLSHDTLVVTRQIEMLNIFLGFEQTNKYTITTVDGTPVGYIAEEQRSFFSIMSRQFFRTHRPFRAVVMDLEGAPILWLRRPFSWINSQMFVQRQDAEASQEMNTNEPVLDTFAEVQQEWHLWRRRYNLFLRDDRRILSLVTDPQPEPDPNRSTADDNEPIFRQISRVDGGFLAWHFNLMNASSAVLAAVNRAFRGFGREFFTDTGQYFVHFRPTEDVVLNGAIAGLQNPSVSSVLPISNKHLTVEERALVLATAINIDFDYFSRHSEGGHSGLGFGLWGGNWE